MALTLITPHQRPNSGGVYAIEQFARYASALTDVQIVVAKGEPVPIDGVGMHGPRALETLTLPPADALLIPADMRNAERLFGLPPDRGMPIALFQGYGIRHDPVVHANLVLATHAICTSSWLVDEALAAGCTATLLRYGLDREVVFPGPPTDARGPVVAMMTHPLDWKGTADGLEALRLARLEIPDLEVRLFGKLEPEFESATFLPAPNQLSDVATLLRESAVFVCSSWEEGFGIPGIEAISCGAALATTDTKGSRDYAFHERTALVSEPRDATTLAANIVKLIRDPGMRARLIDAGRNYVDGIYPNWEDAAEPFLAAVLDGVRAVSAARTARFAEPSDSAGGLPDLSVPSSMWREARRAKLLLREAMAERNELEAQLQRRIEKTTATEVLARDLRARLKHERKALERSEAELAVAEERSAQLAGRLAAAERELAELGSEIELTGAQRRRLQSALARARADAQVAEAERAGLERTTAQLSGLVERYTEEREAQRNGRRAQAASAIAAVQSLPSAARTWPPLPASERDAQQTFRSQYSELVALLPGSQHGRDPLALPMPDDLRGMLAAADEDQGAGVPSVDVVVCVHNALEHVRMCLWSLLQKASRRFRLIVVNDGSDEETSSFLAELAARLAAVTLIDRVEEPHGYTVAANVGVRASGSDYVVMLNSDTIVSYGWLERIVDFGERNDQVGILGPLSNAATHQSVPERRSAGQWATNPLPDWLTEDGVALILEQAAPRTDTRLPFINGFCFVIKRAVISAIGEFDEQSFAAGYAEESDYAQRARAAGFELAVVDDAYVYHAKSQSYGSVAGKKVSRSAYQTFLDKHGADEINRLVKEIEADSSLDPVRAAVADAIVSPRATESVLAKHLGPALSVAFVLPGLGDGGSGGSHSIYQEVHGLRSLGVDARIALHERAWDRAQAAYDDAGEMFQTYRDVDDLAALTADANVIIATHFKSVATVAGVYAQRDDFLPAYYVQDYEPLFKFADTADNEEAAASYTAIPGTLVFAKTHWLCNVVSRSHGVFVAKVEPSIDEKLYRPGDRSAPAGPVRIAAMVRPRTPRRQPFSTVGVLERLVEKLPGAVEVTTFGCHEPELRKITNSPAVHACHRGLLKREHVAELLRGSDVFLDMSSYQAFGRTALEAMACGCTAVVPRIGGVWDFAQDGQNLVAIDTLDRDAAFEAVAALVDDRERLAELKSAARETAARYSILRAALSEYIVLRQAYQARLS